MNNIGGAALVGSIGAIGGGVLGIMAGSIANGNTSDGINDGLAPVGVLGLFGLGASSLGFAGWAAMDAAKAVGPGAGRVLAVGGALAGVAAVAGLAGYGGFQLAMHDG